MCCGTFCVRIGSSVASVATGTSPLLLSALQVLLLQLSHSSAECIFMFLRKRTKRFQSMRMRMDCHCACLFSLPLHFVIEFKTSTMWVATCTTLKEPLSGVHGTFTIDRDFVKLKDIRANTGPAGRVTATGRLPVTPQAANTASTTFPAVH